jgi:multidrug transporter EmrE-like cation transporter
LVGENLTWLVVVGAIFSNVFASVFLKIAAQADFARWRDSLATLLLPGGLSVFFYCCAFFLYAISLKSLPLHIAQPLTTAGPIILISITSVVVFKEKFGPLFPLGLALILFGIVILAFEGRNP